MAQKTAYGIPVPRGVQKDWDATSMTRDSAGAFLLRYAGNEWGDPVRCVAWFDRFERCRLCVGEYANGRSITVRIGINGNWKASFGAASVDTHPKGGDANAAPALLSGAVPTQSGDAQPLSPTGPSK